MYRETFPSLGSFYNHLILSGTKITCNPLFATAVFYNHLILSGTKINESGEWEEKEFYNHLILSGTKMIMLIVLFVH